MNDRGVVLLEVLIAIAILSMVAVSGVAFLVAAYDSHNRIRARESELVRAERVLTAMTLLTRRELQQRLGVRETGDFVVWLDRPEPSLYRVGVAPATRPAAELLVTLIYRTESESDSTIDAEAEPSDAESNDRGDRLPKDPVGTAQPGGGSR